MDFSHFLVECSVNGTNSKVPKKDYNNWVKLTLHFTTNSDVEVNEEFLEHICAPFGDIGDTIVRSHHRTQYPTFSTHGYGVVFFYDANCALRAMESLQGKVFNGIHIKCSLSPKVNNDHPSTLRHNVLTNDIFGSALPTPSSLHHHSHSQRDYAPGGSLGKSLGLSIFTGSQLTERNTESNHLLHPSLQQQQFQDRHSLTASDLYSAYSSGHSSHGASPRNLTHNQDRLTNSAATTGFNGFGSSPRMRGEMGFNGLDLNFPDESPLSSFSRSSPTAPFQHSREAQQQQPPSTIFDQLSRGVSPSVSRMDPSFPRPAPISLGGFDGPSITSGIFGSQNGTPTNLSNASSRSPSVGNGTPTNHYYNSEDSNRSEMEQYYMHMNRQRQQQGNTPTGSRGTSPRNYVSGNTISSTSLYMQTLQNAHHVQQQQQQHQHSAQQHYQHQQQHASAGIAMNGPSWLSRGSNF